MPDPTYAQDRLNAANSDLREARATIGKLTQEIERLKKELHNPLIAAQALREAADTLDTYPDADEPDPLDESNHADRIDRDRDRWFWCDGCEGFRMGIHGMRRPGWTAAEIDAEYGPLKFARRPACIARSIALDTITNPKEQS
jgi:uncharacterized small protein (DUF1192 family)